MKKVISILAMILLVINMSSCTPESITEDSPIPQACCSEDEEILPPPPPPPNGD